MFPKGVSAWRTAAVGLLVLALMSCSQQSPEQLLSSAREHLTKGERSAAVIQLKNLLVKAPDHGEARLLLGQALFDGGDWVSAEKELSRALELKQPHEKVVPTYVLALLALGRNDAVVSTVEKYRLFSPPAVAVAQTARGDAYLRLGKREQAKEAYAAALAAVPTHPRARLGEAILVAFEGRIEDALKRVDEVVAADPKLGEAHAFRADIKLAQGDRAGARAALEDAVAADGSFVNARISLISLLMDDGELEAASKLLGSTRALARQDLRLNYLEASLALRKGELEKARQQVQQMLKHLPDSVPALVLAGMIEYRAEQFAAAEAPLRKAVARAPNHLGARQLLAQTYLRLGQPTKAKEILQPLVDRGLPDIPRLQLLAGEIYLANGDLRRATAFYQAAAKAQGSPQVGARTRLGQIALASGRSEEGFAELEAASEIDAGAHGADLARIVGHIRRREFDKATEAAKALERKQPSNPLTFQMYGAINVARRDMEAARKNYERALELRPNYLPAAYALAQIDLLQKKPDVARKRYEAMIAKEPANDLIYVALAELQGRLGDDQTKVVETLRRAVKANRQSKAAWLALIQAQLVARDTKGALGSVQEALAALPSDPQILDLAGVVQELSGEINQAIATYSKLASLQPESPQPLYRLTSLYQRQNEPDKALESLRRVQKIAPRDPHLLPQLTRVFIGAGRHDEALKEARELQKRDPRSASGWVLEGDVHLAQRRLADAERSFREALKVDPAANAVAVKLHETLIAAGKKADADAWGRKWSADNPKDSLMRLYLGDREGAAKNYKAAAAHYRAVIEIEPNNVAALNNLAWIGGELGDPKALSYAERALALAPLNATVLDTYGMLLLKKGDVERALRTLSLASQAAPGRHEYRLNFARALIRAGRKPEAQKELEALQAIKENFNGKNEIPKLLAQL